MTRGDLFHAEKRSETPRSAASRTHRARLSAVSGRLCAHRDGAYARRLLRECGGARAVLFERQRDGLGHGGTRTASITGAFVALVEACATFYTKRGVFPVRDYTAAVSVGIGAENTPLLDICYEEDAQAMVDMNLVMTGAGSFIEVQGTGEGRAFSRAEMNALLDLGERGIRELIDVQKRALGETLSWLPGREG